MTLVLSLCPLLPSLVQLVWSHGHLRAFAVLPTLFFAQGIAGLLWFLFQVPLAVQPVRALSSPPSTVERDPQPL